MTTAVVAVAYGGPEVLELREVDVPPPAAGEVTLEVRAAGINPMDHKILGGMMGADESKLPLRVGLEVAGVVTAVGEDVDSVEVGDEVAAFPVTGGYAGAITARVDSVVPKPASLSWEQAAGLLVTGQTAYHLLEATGVDEGDTVLIHGVAGSVGMLTAQLALDRGATVVGTARADRHEGLRAKGVVPVEYGDGLLDRVRDAAPDGVTVALDTVGTDEAIDVSEALLEDRAKIATIAAFGRGGDGIQVLGGADNPGTEIRRRGTQVVLDKLQEGTLEIVVARSYPLAEAAQAVSLVAGGHAGGKVVLVP